MVNLHWLAEKRAVELHKIQKGDIWLQHNRSFVGYLIRIATQSPVNHTGQITKDGYIFHATRKGLIKEKYNKYPDNASLRITIVRIKDSLFTSIDEKEEIFNNILSNAEAMYSKSLRYSYKLILSISWRAVLRSAGLWRLRTIKNFLDQHRIEIICSQFVDDVWDELEKRKGIDLFSTSVHPKEVTPKDILKSPYVQYVTGWFYPKYFSR